MSQCQQRHLMAVLLVSLAGCVSAPRRRVEHGKTPPAVTRPALEKTFGEVSYQGPPPERTLSGGTLSGGTTSLQLHYKNIRLLIDPLSAEASPVVDYVLLTDAQPSHFGATARQSLRKDVKIIASGEEASKISSEGFSQVKTLGPGQRIMLSKEGAFLFVSAVQGRHPVSGRLVNGYLLEFDNGRNVFVCGEIVEMAVLKQFLYGLRDDGKEIHLGFFPGRDEGLAAEMIALFQPQLAVLLPQVDESAVRRALENQIFSGQYFVATPGEKIPF